MIKNRDKASFMYSAYFSVYIIFIVPAQMHG